MPSSSLAIAARMRHFSQINQSYEKQLQKMTEITNKSTNSQIYYSVWSIEDIGAYCNHYVGRLLYFTDDFEKSFKEYIWYWIHQGEYYETIIWDESVYILVESYIHPTVLNPQIIISSSMPYYFLYLNDGFSYCAGRPGIIINLINKSGSLSGEMIKQIEALEHEFNTKSKKELLKMLGYSSCWKYLTTSKSKLRKNLLMNRFYSIYRQIYKVATRKIDDDLFD